MNIECRELYQRHHAPLVRFLTRLTHCGQRAEDLAQAAWLKLLTMCASGSCPATGERALRAYLYAVARNVFIDECTRKFGFARTRSMDPKDMEALANSGVELQGPDEDVAREQISDLVRQALSTLPPEQRAVIEMWSRGTSIRDMAARSSAPVETVLSRKKYAFGKLRRELAAGLAAL